MNPQIKVKNLSKSFTTYVKEPGVMGSFKSLFWRKTKMIEAVKNVSFSISPGELVGFIGPNGAGKTTTLKMLSGLLHPTSGECRVLGFNPFLRDQKYLKEISLIMGQKSQLWPDLPAIETFELNKAIYEVPDMEYKEIMEEMINLLEIKDVIHQQARKMSLGQRMKCELVASLLYRPKILFLDEPTLGLDVLVQKKLRIFIKEYNKKYGATVLLTSHYMDDVKEICDRVIIINHGGLIYDGTVNNLIKQHANYKTITLIFNNKVLLSNLEKIGRVTEYDDLKASIEVPRNQVAKMASRLLSEFDVDDLDIQEPRLENIIAEVFDNNK
ncbi:MAG: ATP-binding cassette domain-containing protein [Candidatus Shapirobacteria bacterium]